MNFFFIGIGGISMSALAVILKSQGHAVSGSDLQPVELLGVKTFLGHNAQNIICADVVVYTGAIAEDNPELKYAKQKGIRVLDRAELLALVEKDYKHSIAIAGSHGKTTTAAMVAHIFKCAGLNPTVHIGGIANNFGSNVVIGGNDFFITEACEFKRSFLKLTPTVAVITNIDADHMDCYKDLNDIKQAFNQFANNAKHVITKGVAIRNLKLQIPGEYNLENAYLAAAVARHYKIPNKVIKEALESFTGVKRRFEKVGVLNGAEVVIDYAHHPKEIESVFKLVKNRKCIAVFQPHTYTRTKTLFNDFVTVLSRFENIIIAPTYAAREKPIEGFTHIDLAKGIPHALVLDDIAEYLEKQKCDLILILGAGDIANTLTSRLNLV